MDYKIQLILSHWQNFDYIQKPFDGESSYSNWMHLNCHWWHQEDCYASHDEYLLEVVNLEDSVSMESLKK